MKPFMLLILLAYPLAAVFADAPITTKERIQAASEAATASMARLAEELQTSDANKLILHPDIKKAIDLKATTKHATLPQSNILIDMTLSSSKRLTGRVTVQIYGEQVRIDSIAFAVPYHRVPEHKDRIEALDIMEQVITAWSIIHITDEVQRTAMLSDFKSARPKLLKVGGQHTYGHSHQYTCSVIQDARKNPVLYLSVRKSIYSE